MTTAQTDCNLMPEMAAITKRTPHPVGIPLLSYLIRSVKPAAFLYYAEHSLSDYFGLCAAFQNSDEVPKCYAVVRQNEPHSIETLFQANTKIEAFSSIIPVTGPSDLTNFGDHSIDLAHLTSIRSLNEIEETFHFLLPKLSNRAILTLNGIDNHIPGTEIWEFWSRLKTQYPTFDFPSGNGLGMAAIGPEYPRELDLFFDANGEQERILRDYFFVKGQNLEMSAQIGKYNLQMTDQEQQIQELYQSVEKVIKKNQKLAAKTHRLSSESNEKDQTIKNIYASRTWKIGSIFRIPIAKLFPEGGKARALVGKVIRHIRKQVPGGTSDGISGMAISSKVYQRWIINNEPTPNELFQQRQEADQWSSPPLISIVIPIFNPPTDILREALESVIAQTAPNWELCIANGDPTNKEICKLLDNYSKQDDRIRVKTLEKNLGIAGNTNAAIEMARGAFVAFLDHDDLLAPFAVYSVSKTVLEYPACDLIYSDEDHLTEDSKMRYEPFFKPAFSPDYLTGINYICHFLVIRKSIGDRLGWIRNGFEGAQDFDLILRAAEQSGLIAHIPQILYHWRAIKGSTAKHLDAKDYATASGIKAVQEHLERLGRSGSVVLGPIPTSYRVIYELAETPLISMIIPSHDHAEELMLCVDSILEKTTYKNYEILIVENNSRDPLTFKLYRNFSQNPKIKVIEFNHPFNFSTINNYAASQASGDMLLFLNNDTEIISPDWLEQMAVYANRNDVGIVGAKLYYPDDTIQHAGVVIGAGGIAGHSFHKMPRKENGYFLNLKCVMNVSAVTGACMIMRKKVFEEIHGFDENYRLAFGDVDICLKSLRAGYLNIWTPFAELYHYESKTRGYEDNPEKVRRFMKETDYFKRIWGDALLNGDDYYNSNLSLTNVCYLIDPLIHNPAVTTSRGLSK